MTLFISGHELKDLVDDMVPGAVDYAEESALWIESSKILDICKVMKNNENRGFRIQPYPTVSNRIQNHKMFKLCRIQKMNIAFCCLTLSDATPVRLNL